MGGSGTCPSASSSESKSLSGLISHRHYQEIDRVDYVVFNDQALSGQLVDSKERAADRGLICN